MPSSADHGLVAHATNDPPTDIDMKRRLVRSLAALSLIIAVVAIFVGIYTGSCFITHSLEKSTFEIHFSRSGFSVYSERIYDPPDGSVASWTDYQSPYGWTLEFYDQFEGSRQYYIPPFTPDTDFDWGRLRYVSWDNSRRSWPSITRVLTVPSWAMLLMLLALPGAVAISSYRQKKRIKPGYCKTCGYDLRATPDRCPECGATKSGPA